MVGRLVEHEAVHAARGEQRERGAGALARGEGRGRRASTWSAPRPNLASSVRASAGAKRRLLGEVGEQRSPAKRLAALLELARRRSRGPTLRLPEASGSSPSSARSSVVLPDAVRADDGDAVADSGARGRSGRGGSRRARPRRRRARRSTPPARASGERELEPPGLPRLVDLLEPAPAAASPGRPSTRCVRRAAVRAARLSGDLRAPPSACACDRRSRQQLLDLHRDARRTRAYARSCSARARSRAAS